MRNVPPDIALGCVLLFMAVLGGILSFYAPVKGWAKALCAAGFLLLGFGGSYFTIQQSKAATRSATELSDKITSLGKSQTDLKEAQERNTELQGRLLSQSRTISSLAAESIKTATGADSFCYMMFEGASLARGRPSPSFRHVGKYPLSDVSAMIINVVAFRRARGNSKTGGMPVIDVRGDVRGDIRLGDLAVGIERVLTETVFQFSDGEDQFFQIHYAAKNGLWRQALRLRRVDGKWLIATRVFRGELGKKRTLYRYVEQGFPTTDKGDIDWDLDALP